VAHLFDHGIDGRDSGLGSAPLGAYPLYLPGRFRLWGGHNGRKSELRDRSILYALAGYSRNRGNATTLLKRDESIQKRVAELRAQVEGRSRKLQELAREIGVEMLDVLYEVAKDPEQPGATRVAAANSVLDRGYGRAPLFQGDDPEKLCDVLAMTDAELEAILRDHGHGNSGGAEEPPPSSPVLDRLH
jgi:hypothetical protein